MTPVRPRVLLLASLVALGTGCSQAPAEPVRQRTASGDPTPQFPGPEVVPSEGRRLQWTAPATFVAQGEQERGSLKGFRYRIDPAGADKEPAELLVSSAPSGKAGELEGSFDAWLREFDGDPATSAVRDTFEVGTVKVHTLEVAGTYKQGLGPAIGQRARHPVSVVKQGWRMLAAAAQTTDRGRWFFHLVGPDDTVQSARSAFRALLDSLH